MWSPLDVEEKMEQVCERLEAAVATYKALGEISATKANTAKLEESKLMLRTTQLPGLKSAELRKAWVFEQIADLVLEADIAEHQTAAQREVIRSLTSESDLLRTMAASHRQMTNSFG